MLNYARVSAHSRNAMCNLIFGVYFQVNPPGGIAQCLTKSCSLLLSIV